jgi:hypothetical protein
MHLHSMKLGGSSLLVCGLFSSLVTEYVVAQPTKSVVDNMSSKKDELLVGGSTPTPPWIPVPSGVVIKFKKR